MAPSNQSQNPSVRKKVRPSPSRLREVLNYNKTSGLLTWKVRAGPKTAGSPAGCRLKKGYLHVGIDGQLFLGHVLVWTIVKGRWPVGEIDHRNLDRRDNSWKNLREANDSENAANRPKRGDSLQPYKGVRLQGKRWRAMTSINGRRQHLGYFKTAELAAAAYLAKQIEIHGDFARAA